MLLLEPSLFSRALSTSLHILRLWVLELYQLVKPSTFEILRFSLQFLKFTRLVEFWDNFREGKN